MADALGPASGYPLDARDYRTQPNDRLIDEESWLMGHVRSCRMSR